MDGCRWTEEPERRFSRFEVVGRGVEVTRERCRLQAGTTSSGSKQNGAAGSRFLPLYSVFKAGEVGFVGAGAPVEQGVGDFGFEIMTSSHIVSSLLSLAVTLHTCAC